MKNGEEIMELTHSEAREILKNNNIEIAIEDPRTIEEIAIQLLEIGDVALSGFNQENT